jgi:chitinase
MRAGGDFVTYDTPQCAAEKVKYLQSKGMGGAGWWEVSADIPCNTTGSIISQVRQQLGPIMEKGQNILDYPYSKYDNLRMGMGNESLAGACGGPY